MIYRDDKGLPALCPKFKFNFHYESDTTFDRLVQFVCSKNTCTQKMVKIARLVHNSFKKVSFQFFFCLLLLLLLLITFDKLISKTTQDTGGKILYDDWNPCQVVQEHINFFVNNFFYL